MVKIIQQDIIFIDLVIQKYYLNILLIIILIVKLQMKKNSLAIAVGCGSSEATVDVNP